MNVFCPAGQMQAVTALLTSGGLLPSSTKVTPARADTVRGISVDGTFVVVKGHPMEPDPALIEQVHAAGLLFIELDDGFRRARAMQR